MTWVAVAIGGGALIGGIVSSSGAQSAASTQANAANQAAQIGYNEFNTITQQESPYMQSGYSAQNQLNYLLGDQPGSAYTGSLQSGASSPAMMQANDTALQPGATGTREGGIFGTGASFAGSAAGPTSANPALPTPRSGLPANPQREGASTAGGFGSLLSPFTAQNFQQFSPAYQFQQQQGMQGVLNSDASSVGAESGAASKDLINYNQSLANTSFNNAFNQYQTQQGNIYSRLAGVAQLGQNAAANTGAQGVNLASSIGQSVTNAGSALAAGQVGSANAYSSAVGTASAIPWLMNNGVGGGGGFTDTGGSNPGSVG